MRKNFLGGRTAAILLILALGILVYARTFEAPFTFDDKWSLIENDTIRTLANFYADSIGYGTFPHRFVGYFTFALNYRLGGFEVTGYHVVNVAIHLGCALLVYALLCLTFRTPYFRVAAAGYRVPASAREDAEPSWSAQRGTLNLVPLFAALLFVAHPVQTQAVTYIVQRVTSLCTFFYLLSIVLYLQARLRSEVDTLHAFAPGRGLSRGARRGGSGARVTWLLLGGSVVAALLAMKTKEIAVTLPVAVLLCEVFFFEGRWTRRLLYLLPLLATLPVVPVSVFSTGGGAGEAPSDFSEVLSDVGEKSRAFTSMSRLDYLFTQFRVIVTYLRLLVLPVGQNLDYEYPLYTTFWTPPVFLSFLFLVGLFGLAVYLYLRSRPSSLISPPSSDGSSPALGLAQPQSRSRVALRLVSFGLLWFFLALSVESSIIPIPDLIFEHRLYLPAFGAATAFAAGLAFVCDRFASRGSSRWFTAVAAVIVASLAVATLQRNELWRSELRLWQDVAVKSPTKGRVLNNLAVALEEAGRRAEAAALLSRALEVDPTYAKSYYNLGDLYLVSGRPDLALPLFEKAIRLNPGLTPAYVKVGAALIRGRRFQEAAAFLEQNLDRVGDNGEARLYLGAAYLFLGNRERALRELAAVSRLDPAHAASLAALLGVGRPQGPPREHD